MTAQNQQSSQAIASPEPPLPLTSIDDDAAEIPSWRKWIILFVVCWMPLPMTFWSTAIMPATEEVATAFGVPTTSINTANAGVFVAMAMSGLIWLPISTIIGRRTTYLVANVVLCSCSIGVALSPNLACFATLWIIGGTTGPFFLVAGQTILADIFEPASTDHSVHVPGANCRRRFAEQLLASSSAAASVPTLSVSQPVDKLTGFD